MVILMVGQVDLKMVYDDLSRFFLMVNAYHGLHMMTKCVYIYVDFQMEEWMVYNVFFMVLELFFMMVLICVFKMCLMKVYRMFFNGFIMIF